MGILGKLVMGGLVATAAARPAIAADWLKQIVEPPPGIEVQSDPVELGTGWYLRGDVGGGLDTITNFGAKPDMRTWSVDLGVGYKLNDWFRLDASLDMRKVQSTSTTAQSGTSRVAVPPRTAPVPASGSRPFQPGRASRVG